MNILNINIGKKVLDIYTASCKGYNCIYIAIPVGRCSSYNKYLNVIKLFDEHINDYYKIIEILDFNYRDNKFPIHGQKIIVFKE
jgi:hypothetical protein